MKIRFNRIIKPAVTLYRPVSKDRIWFSASGEFQRIRRNKIQCRRALFETLETFVFGVTFI